VESYRSDVMVSVSSGSGILSGSSGAGVDRIPWGSRRMQPIMEGIDLGKCLRMSLLVKPGQVAKKSVSIAAQKVFGGG